MTFHAVFPDPFNCHIFLLMTECEQCSGSATFWHGSECGSGSFGRQSCRVTCLLISVSGGDQGEFWEYKDDLSNTSLKFSSSTAVVFHSGVAFGIGLCEIMGTVFACLLAKKFNSKFDRMV
jgi:hypothetical protein